MQAHLLERVAVGDRVDHDHELVAGIARHEVLAAHAAAQACRDLLQHAVAGLVAERVVDVLEAVEVDEQDPEARLAAVGAHTLDAARELLREGFAVGQAGQAVGAQAGLHALEAAGQFADLVAARQSDRGVEVAFANASRCRGQAAQVAGDPADDAEPDGNRHQHGERGEHDGAAHVVDDAAEVVAGGHGDDGDPVQAGLVADAVECRVRQVAAGVLELEHARQARIGAVGDARAHRLVGGLEQRVVAGVGGDTPVAAIGQGDDVCACRGGNQVAVGFDDEGDAVGRHVEPADEIVEGLERDVGRDHAGEPATGLEYPARARGHELQGAEVDIDRGPGVALGIAAVRIPGALARIEQVAFTADEVERAVESGHMVDGTVFVGLELHAQLDLVVGAAEQAQALAGFVTVIDVVVGVGVDGGRHPEAVAQFVEVVFDVLRRRHAFRKGRLEYGTGADDVAVDGLRDSPHHLEQQLRRDRRHCVAARAVREHAERQRQTHDEDDVGDDEHEPQGQLLGA